MKWKGVKYRSLVGAGGGQETQQEREEGWEDLSKSSGGVGHHDLPHVEGSLSNHKLGVWTTHVEAGEDAVTPISAKSTDDGLWGKFKGQQCLTNQCFLENSGTKPSFEGKYQYVVLFLLTG